VVTLTHRQKKGKRRKVVEEGEKRYQKIGRAEERNRGNKRLKKETQNTQAHS
jgi:hypothetical protein